MNRTLFRNASLILSDGILPKAGLMVEGDRIVAILFDDSSQPDAIDLGGQYLSPGFVDVHVHGGDGADFMDGTAEAFDAVCRCHARHGTTSLAPTSTVASLAQYDRFLELTADAIGRPTGGAKVVGCHFYGPYFARPARGCHPDQDFLTPAPENAERFGRFAERMPLIVTVAPELPNAEWLVRALIAKGCRVNAGHSHATFSQVEAAVGWGVRHVDHLFCAMSDRARLRQTQTYPMRGGVMEATLYFDELTTEVIADGQHLTDDLLRLAFKMKGPDRLALVTDSMRAVDLPDGEYWFGAEGSGERVRKQGNVGVTTDGLALASGVMGLDHGVRTMAAATKAPLHEVIRMASLTPARILGVNQEVGSIAVGKKADLLVLDAELNVRQVYVDGRRWA